MKSMMIYLFLLFTFGSLNGITNAQSSRWASSGCKPHTDNCNNYCDDIEGGKYEDCYAEDNGSCWIAGLITGKICNCRCDTPDCNLCGNPCHALYCRPSVLSGACSFVDIKGAVKSKCDISNLDKVDQEIAGKIAFNVGGAILGSLPYVGSAVNVVWSVWGTVNDDSTDLSNALRTEINNKIKELKDCMDSKISELKYDLYDGKRRDIATRYEAVIGASGSDKITAIDGLFDNFGGYIADIFKDDMNNIYSYTEYESMLPIYTALVPLWASLASDQLFIQQNQSDWSNYKNDARTAMNGLETFKSWIIRAKQSIKNSLTPPDNQPSCQDPPHTANQAVTVATYMMDTSKRGTQCGYTITMNSRDWSDRHNWCGAFEQFVQQKRNEISNHIVSWEKDFDERYIANIDLYIDSLISPILEIKNNNKCMDVVNDNVVVADCNNNDKEMDQQKWYYVFSTKEIKTRDDKCLDIYYFVGPNVQIVDCTGTTAQQWEFSKISTSKEIKNDNGKCLDVSGSNVQIGDCNELSGQQWDESIVYMNTEIKNNGKCLDIENGNVVVADCNGNDGQKWYYVRQTYEIRNANGKCMDVYYYVGSNVQIVDCTGTTAQKWYFRESTKELVNANGKCLDVYYYVGPNVQVVTCTGTTAQKWDTSIPPIKPVIKNNGKCLSIENGNNNVVIENCADTDDQRWYYVGPTKEIRNTNGECLDVYHYVGPNVQIVRCTGVSAQKWYINQKKKEIKNYNGKCLDVHNYVGPNVQVVDCTGVSAQRWSASIVYPNPHINIDTMSNNYGNKHNGYNIHAIFIAILLLCLLLSSINIYYCVKNRNKMKYGQYSEFYETE